MVFGLGHRSREADVVLWDAVNYPSLPLADHRLFFAESARVVLEGKSRWSANEFRDILDKCRAVRDIVVVHAPNLEDDVAMIQLELQALKDGREHSGMLTTKPHIATAAFVFLGGQDFAPDRLESVWVDQADDAWPDVMILLEPGVVVGKTYVAGETPLSGSGYLEFWDAGDDSLLVFSAALLSLANERSVQVEDPSYLSLYIQDVMSRLGHDVVEFRLSRPPSARVTLWH
ncbi:MAG: hypothetical protein A3J28_13180 [Acidobacteria bacterium RIFCSPLOWO2_12_FULL_60_22]|nr:MAG: hypothetical protein A3J28_13180 [Acidobacteria bacterium RIFCSPLOWO2_12_FULL_60_22]